MDLIAGPNRCPVNPRLNGQRAAAVVDLAKLVAAKAAIRFEKPALTAVDAHSTIEKVHYAISDEPMSPEEWAAQYCKPPPSE
jgi:hypothetical protein